MRPWPFVLNVIAVLAAVVVLSPFIVYWKITKQEG